MKTIVVIVLVGLAANLFGQAVHLTVTPLPSKIETTANEEARFIGPPGSFSKKTEREEALRITLRNTAPIAFTYTVEWMFFGAPIKGGPSQPFHAGEKQIALEKNASETFEVRSSKLQSTHLHRNIRRGSDVDIYGGSKYAGYVVRAKIDDKVLAVEAPDAATKRQYQDPKAKWGATAEAAPAPRPPGPGKKKAKS